MKRWNRIKAKYVETKAYWNRTGAGLLPEDEYQTIEEKKEGMCPMFNELDAIYGDKPNIKALKVHDSMLTRRSHIYLPADESTVYSTFTEGLILDGLKAAQGDFGLDLDPSSHRTMSKNIKKV